MTNSSFSFLSTFVNYDILENSTCKFLPISSECSIFLAELAPSNSFDSLLVLNRYILHDYREAK